MKRSAQVESFCFFRPGWGHSLVGMRWLSLLSACLALLLLAASPVHAAVKVYIGGTPQASIPTGQGYNFTPWAGPSSSKLKFMVSNKPGWASFDTSTGKLSGRAGTAGTYKNIGIGVTDGSTSSWLPNFTITVGSGSSAPPPTGSTSSGSAFQVYSDGVFHWQGDYSWGVTINYKDTNGSPLTGPYDISVSGIGGFQPYATNYDFDPSPYKYLVVSLKPTVANQKWNSAFYAVGDVLTGTGVNVLNYGPAPVVGQWTTYKIPLGAGGYQIPSGTHIYKFMFQDQTADVSGSGYQTNKWYVDNVYFTSDTSSPTTTTPSSSGSSSSSSSTSSTGTSPSSSSTTTTTTTTFDIYSNGVYKWQDDWSWSVVVNYKDTAGKPLSGPYDISVKGIGGYQPHAPSSDFNTSPYKYVTVALKPTIPNQKWSSTMYATNGSVAGHGVNVLNYGPPPVVGQWNTYKIPLGAGGYEMPAGTHIYKFMFQDQTADVSGSGYSTNTWYVDNLGFTTDGSAVSTGGGSTGGSGSGSGGGGTTLPSGVTWMYLNGVKTLAGDFTGQGDSTDYEHSTSSGYNGDTKDILITDPNPWGYFIPYWASNFRLPNPGYQYLLLSLKPSITGDTFNIHAERVGDQGLPPIQVMNYGPPAVAGKWTSYVIPLKDLGVLGDATLYKVVFQTNTGAADSWEMDAIGFK